METKIKSTLEFLGVANLQELTAKIREINPLAREWEIEQRLHKLVKARQVVNKQILIKLKTSPRMQNNQYVSFEAFAKATRLITWKEAEALGLPLSPKWLVEDTNDFYTIYACTDGEVLALDLSEAHKVHIVTESIVDGEDDITFCYSTGLHYVNRERYYLCRNDINAQYEEKIELDHAE